MNLEVVVRIPDVLLIRTGIEAKDTTTCRPHALVIGLEAAVEVALREAICVVCTALWHANIIIGIVVEIRGVEQELLVAKLDIWRTISHKAHIECHRHKALLWHKDILHNLLVCDGSIGIYGVVRQIWQDNLIMMVNEGHHLCHIVKILCLKGYILHSLAVHIHNILKIDMMLARLRYSKLILVSDIGNPLAIELKLEAVAVAILADAHDGQNLTRSRATIKAVCRNEHIHWEQLLGAGVRDGKHHRNIRAKLAISRHTTIYLGTYPCWHELLGAHKDDANLTLQVAILDYDRAALVLRAALETIHIERYHTLARSGIKLHPVANGEAGVEGARHLLVILNPRHLKLIEVYGSAIELLDAKAELELLGCRLTTLRISLNYRIGLVNREYEVVVSHRCNLVRN